jgi:hypothetical protein
MVPDPDRRTTTASTPNHTLTMVLLVFNLMTKSSFTNAYVGVRRNMSNAINHQTTTYLRLLNNQSEPNLIRFDHCRQQLGSTNTCLTNAYLQNIDTSSRFTVQTNRLYQTSTALKGTLNPSEEQSANQKAKSKQKSRKQRKRTAKTMQRIDRVLADRGVGTRSKTFELAKSGRITMADHADAPHEERIRIKGPSEKVPSDAVLFLDGKVRYSSVL